MKNMVNILKLLCIATVIAFGSAGCEQASGPAAKAKETVQPPKPMAPPSTDASPKDAASKFSAGWNPFRSEVAVSDIAGQSGAKALLVKTTKDLYSGLTFGTDAQSKPDGTIQVKPNTGYHATIYVKGTGDVANVELQFATLTAEGKPSNTVKRALNDKWQRIDLKFKTGAATKSIGFLLGKRNQMKPVSFYVDDLNLAELPAK